MVRCCGCQYKHGDSNVNRFNRLSYFDMEGQSIGTHILNPGENVGPSE